VARTVFKTAEAFARGLVGSIPTLSRQLGINVNLTRVFEYRRVPKSLMRHYAVSVRSGSARKTGAT
jgi:hypothetical protein